MGRVVTADSGSDETRMACDEEKAARENDVTV
jgi:hypothetical protein